MEPERRQITVLFTDMVGFTPFSQNAGEEAAFRLMREIAEMTDEAVSEFGGVIQGFTGDGVMAVFGAPVAQEDAPVFACRAALGFLARIRAAGPDLERRYGLTPQFRVGLATGPAIYGSLVGKIGQGVTVMGDVVNLAARLQSLAPPGAAVMNEDMQRLVEGRAECAFVRQVEVKGRSGVQRLYRLNSAPEPSTRFGASLRRGLTAFVGRDSELEQLERLFAALGSAVQTIDIVGEPGIGKSRLAHEFRCQTIGDRLRILSGYCARDDRATPFSCFVGVLRDGFRIAAGEDPAMARKLGEGLEVLGLHSAENEALLLNLLGQPVPAGALDGLDGVLIGLRTRELLKRIIEARARQGPMMLVFEDIHWLDSASQELLESLVGLEGRIGLMILHTRRPDYQPPWLGRANVTTLTLKPLTSRQSARIATARLGVERLPREIGDLIASTAEGNPLFAEEMAHYLAERGALARVGDEVRFDAGVLHGALPATIQSVFASRVDQLPAEARSFLQMAAVFGRRFAPLFIAGLCGAHFEVAAMGALEATGLVIRDEASQECSFKHALLRDTIYDRLLSDARAAMHLKVAEELERRGGASLMENAELLAHHFRAGESPIKAFKYAVLAGDKSLNVYAVNEAETYFRSALAIFDEHPAAANPPHAVRALVGLLETLMLKGDYRQGAGLAERFLPLLKQVGDSAEVVKADYYYALSLVQRFELRAGHDRMREALEIAERIGDGRARAYARAGLLHCRTRLGLDSFEAAEAAKAALMRDAHEFGDNFVRNAAYFAATWDYFYRGLVNEARAMAIRLIASGEKRGDPRAIGFANWMLGWIQIVCGAPDAAIGYAEECAHVATTPFDRLQGEIIRAVALVLSGHAAEGLEKMDRLNREFERLGALYNVLGAPRGAALVALGRVTEGIG